MKQFLLFFTSLMFVSVIIKAQNDQDWASKTYDIEDFTQLVLEGGYKVYLSQGNDCSLTVRAKDSGVFDVLKVRHDGKKMRLNIEREKFDFDRINLYITFMKLEKVNIEGGVSLKTRGYLDLNDFILQVEGGAKIDLDIKADNMEILGNGGVLFNLNGVARSLKVKLTGAGHLDADDLKTEDVVIYIEGLGTGSVYATKTLDARIHGVGKVTYKGEPNVTQYIDGLGSVKRN